MGDRVIIMSYCLLDANEVKNHKPKMIFVNEKNKINEIQLFEKHGDIK